MLKVTSVNKAGCESYPASVEINAAGYVLLPEDPDAASYNVYAPLKGFEETGPWYWLRSYRRSEARRAHFTVVGLHDNNDLAPQLCPQDSLLTLPEPLLGQEYWLLGGNVGDMYIPLAIVKCEGVM